MSLERNVVWSEGMFIAPQHFQQFDRAMRAYAEGLARLDAWGDDYGFAQLELNAEHFGIGKLSVRRAIGVLPDRTYFELDAEQSMDIPDGTVEKTVYLAVPLARLGTTQVGQRRGVHRMLSERVDLHDLSDHMNEPIDAEVASLGVCLRIEGDDLSGFAVIPVARILEKTAEGALVLDRGFVPPALAIAASDTLMDRLSDIISLARARAANTGGRIEAVRNSQSIGSFISERLELEALNRGLFALQNAVAQPQTSARRVYGMLGELTVALEAADAQVTDPLLVYDAREVGPSFDALFTRLRRKLTLQSEKSVVSLPWNTELFEKRRLLRMVIQPRMLQEGRRPVLSVSSPLGNATLREIVPSVCKLAGITAIPELVQMGLPGIRLTPLGTAPSELRDKDGSAFFAVDTGSPHWQKFLEKKEALAMHVDDRIPSLTSTLYLLGQEMADTHAPTMTLTADGISGPETGALRYPVSLSPSVLQSIERTLRAGQETGTGLMQVSAELIGLCGTVRRMQDIHEPHLVRAEIARSIIDLKYRVVQLDYPPSVAENLCLVFAIVIDEFILTSDWGKESGWENLTLVADLFGFRDGGDRFYNIAERALMQPKALNEFLHLIYIFLKLGYRGRYTVGQEKERDRLIHRLERVIDHPDIEVAPAQFGRELRKTRALRQAMPFARKLYFAGLAVLLMVGFVVSARFAEERTAARTLDRFRAETGSGKTPVYVYSSDTKTTVVRND